MIPNERRICDPFSEVLDTAIERFITDFFEEDKIALSSGFDDDLQVAWISEVDLDFFEPPMIDTYLGKSYEEIFIKYYAHRLESYYYSLTDKEERLDLLDSVCQYSPDILTLMITIDKELK